MGKLLLENLTNYCYYNHFFILKKNIMIHLEHNTIEIVFSSDLEVEAEQLQKRMLFLYIKKKKTTEIRLITRNDSSLTTTEIELKKPKLNFNLHYNDDFKEVHQNILKNIRKQNTKGLYLFHGEPGTGKSTYIKHLIYQQTKQVIFLSPRIAGNLEDRSEEHTSELQSRPHLVCRLLLEKKKQSLQYIRHI